MNASNRASPPARPAIVPPGWESDARELHLSPEVHYEVVSDLYPAMTALRVTELYTPSAEVAVAAIVSDA
jgi:hypothetical protein